MSLEYLQHLSFWEVSAICMLHSVLLVLRKYQEKTDHTWVTVDTESGMWTFVFVANAIRDISVSMET